MPKDDTFYSLEHKMHRKERVYLQLKMLTQEIEFSKYKVLEKIGFETTFLSEKLNIARNNVSTELNNLMAEGKVIKILGKPVRYLDRIWLEANAQIMIKDPIIKQDTDFRKLIIETSLICNEKKKYFLVIKINHTI
ncbi:hypothetical protein [Pelosinus propionicus]|uniref:hypothetical protein n=1 Tax=Pelosinus propionicus TaxID=380084 RepID=UPI001FE12E54|nr:hypothetical protein [Pelosinus propionicus]